MRVLVKLSQDVDAASWPHRHAGGLAADATPYGLHHLEEHGHVVRFAPMSAPALRRLGEISAGRFWGLQPVHTVFGPAARLRGTADIVLCMDERVGIPAALLPSRTPVVSGVAWLEDPTLLNPTYVKLARHALARVAGVFTMCSAMVDPLVDDFGAPADRVHVVPLGIDEEHFSPSSAPPVPGRVFSVGDDRMRDYTTLVEALTRVHARHPAMTAEIATTLPISLSEEWGTIHRRRMDAAIRECYARASVVALSLKSTRQGSGLTVILEAMASGRPVVVTDNPGLSDYVKHGVTGLLVPTNSPSAMAEAVQSLIENPERARAMGARGRSRVKQFFTTRHMASSLDAVLRLSRSTSATG